MAIQITVDPVDGNITVAPTLANYKVGDLVQWEAVGGTSLTLSFVKDGTPFNVQPVSAAAGTGMAESRIAAGATGSYHYSVKTTTYGTVYQITSCPEIVVQ